LVYLADGDGAAVQGIAKTLHDEASGDYRVFFGVPLPGRVWRTGAIRNGEPYTDAEINDALLGGESGSSAEGDEQTETEAVLLSRLADTLKNGNPNPAQITGLKYAGRGFYPIPVHGIVKAKQAKERECACQSGKRWFADKNRQPVELCGSPGKHPSVQGWESHNASRDPATLMHLFDPKYNKRREGVNDGLNFGLVTGPATGLVVLDIDGEEGRANLANLAQRTARFLRPSRSPLAAGAGTIISAHPQT
jgi:hypothetical protein